MAEDGSSAWARAKDIIKKDALCNVFVASAITLERAGKKLTDIERMKKELLRRVAKFRAAEKSSRGKAA